VLAWGPLAHGFLTDGFSLEQLAANDFRHHHPYAQGEYLRKLNKLRETLRIIAQDHHKTMVDLAIAWTLRERALTGAIIGIRTEQEAKAMLGGLDWQLTPEELDIIDNTTPGIHP
jgi:aryl-alcohol dehydrogenase-like predicted oxidoreductase